MAELTAPAPRPGRPASRHPSGLVQVAIVAFAVGLLAIAAIMALFASGARDLPLALNLAAMLAPAGLGLGLLAVFVDARRARGRS